MARPVIWIARRLSDATLARADRDYDIIVNYDDLPFNRITGTQRWQKASWPAVWACVAGKHRAPHHL